MANIVHDLLTKQTIAISMDCCLHHVALCTSLNTLCLQSKQLRQLTQDSLDSYVAFFEQYREAGKSINKVKRSTLSATDYNCCKEVMALGAPF